MSRRDGALLFALVGGPVAWTVQLWLGWLMADLGCRLQPGELIIGGLGTGGLWLLIGALSGALALAATYVAWGLARGAAGGADDATGTDDATAHGGRRFVAQAALLLDLLLVGTIVLGATGPLFVTPCA